MVEPGSDQTASSPLPHSLKDALNLIAQLQASNAELAQELAQARLENHQLRQALSSQKPDPPIADQLRQLQGGADVNRASSEDKHLELHLHQLNQQLERQIAEQTAQLELALASARLGRWELDLQTWRERWSLETHLSLGFAMDEQGQVLDLSGSIISPYPTYELFLSCVHPEDRQRVKQALQLALTEGIAYECEFRIVWLDGSVHWRYNRGACLYDRQGQATKMLGISMDITERKQVERSLQESEERFSKAFRSNPIGIAILTFPEGVILDVNDSYLQLLGYQRSEVIGQNTLDLNIWADPDLRAQLMQELLQGRSIHHLEAKFLTKTAEVRTGIVSIELIELGDYPQGEGETRRLCTLKMIYDITDRKQAEQNLHASLLEKEILLKEVHHRVKNNLQIISSLLNLQANTSQIPEIYAALIDSQRRIKVMALVHERLYRSETLAHLDLKGYICRLADDVFQSYLPMGMPINLQVEVDSLRLEADVVIPCGLIISELVSNATKHAFPQGQPGEILIALGPNAGQQHVLTVKDNGVGLPEHIDLTQTESLGLQIVCALVSQIEGTIELDRSNGTRFTITFHTQPDVPG